MQIDIIVAGVIYKEKQGGEGGDDQGRKYLVLCEEGSRTFFIGKWTKYRRVPATADAATNFDANDSSNVKKLESCRSLQDLIPGNSDLGKLKTASMLKKRGEEPPPSIREHRMRMQAQAKAENREAMKQAKIAEAKQVKEREEQARLQREWETAQAASTAKQKELKRQHQEKMDAINQEIEIAKAASIKAIEEARQRAKKDATTTQARPEEARNPLMKPSDMTDPPQEAPLLKSPESKPAITMLPEGWRSTRDSSGRVYYYCKALNVAQYDAPTVNSPPLLPPPRATLNHQMANLHQRTSCEPGSSNDKAMSASLIVNNHRIREIKRLRAIWPYLTTTEKAAASGELAVLEFDLGSSS